MIVMVWYFTEEGILGKKQENLDDFIANNYSFGSLNTSANQQVVSGCTDPSALNYDPDATADNGLCFSVLGCCDTNASNYDPMADSCNVPNNNSLTCNYS